MEEFDNIIIGSGPGGYVTAIRSCQLGFKTALIEKYDSLGGTCLNVGCIPSKTLLDASEKYYEATSSFKEYGIDIIKVKLNWAKMLARKDKVVSENTAGINYLMKKNKVNVFYGTASFNSAKEILISGKQKNVITGKNIIIASGSKPSELPNIKTDKNRIITSTEALSLKEVPNKMVIIGGGVIGLELGSVYAKLGCKVTIVEFFDRILVNFDKDVSKSLLNSLKHYGIDFLLSHSVVSAVAGKKSVVLIAENSDKKTVKIEADYCLVATGRKPNTKELNLSNAGIKCDNKGFIIVDKKLQTVTEGVYAIGDVIGGAMLAHKAEEEGVFVAETLAGQKPSLHYEFMPNVVYTWPEVSSIGLTEEDCIKQGINISKGVFPFKALGRARASGDTDGFAKIITAKDTDQILGVHIVGARASDLIMEAAIAMQYKASAEDIARTCHPHPTFSEAMKESAIGAWSNKYLHM